MRHLSARACTGTKNRGTSCTLLALSSHRMQDKRAWSCRKFLTSSTTRYCYDHRGNVTKKIYQEIGKDAQVTEYGYTLADRLAIIVYPSGAVVTYTRNALGQVQGVSWAPNASAQPVDIVASTTYAPFGPLTSITYGNGRSQIRAYDLDYAIDAISSTPAGALTLDFEVDVMGNIVEVSDSLGQATPDRVYTYDAMHRLTKAETGATPPAPLEAYTYNPTGDRLSASLNGNSPDIYTYVPATHRLASVGATVRTYDESGNTLTGISSGHSLAYDDRKRLRQSMNPASTATYRYNGRGERIGKSVSYGSVEMATTFAYDEGGRLLGEYGAPGNLLAEYVYLDDMPIAVIKDGAPKYIEVDHLGTPRQVIEPSINTVLWMWEMTGSTFGSNEVNEDVDGDGTGLVLNLRFPGQYFDAEAGLHYNSRRDYDSTVGRYVQADPIGLIGGRNLYSYVSNVPLTLIDPDGLQQSFAFSYPDESESSFLCRVGGALRDCSKRTGTECCTTICTDPSGTRLAAPVPDESPSHISCATTKACPPGYSAASSCGRQIHTHSPRPFAPNEYDIKVVRARGVSVGPSNRLWPNNPEEPSPFDNNACLATPSGKIKYRDEQGNTSQVCACP